MVYSVDSAMSSTGIFDRFVHLVQQKKHHDIVGYSADQHAFVVTNAYRFESTIISSLFGVTPTLPYVNRFYRIMRYNGFRKQNLSRNSFRLVNPTYELPPRLIQRWQVSKFRSQIDYHRRQFLSLTSSPASDPPAESRKLFYSFLAEAELFLALLD